MEKNQAVEKQCCFICEKPSNCHWKCDWFDGYFDCSGKVPCGSCRKFKRCEPLIKVCVVSDDNKSVLPI